MIRRLKSRLVVAITTFVVIFVVGIVATYAYFQLSEDHGIVISTGDYEVELFVYFDNNLVSFNSDYYDKDLGVITVNTFDDTADNYIEDLDIYISIKPIVAARYRFKIQQEWELQRYYLNQSEGNEIDPVFQAVYFENLGNAYYPYSQLKFESSFSYLYDKEGYVYAQDIVSKSNTETLYHIIDGGDAYAVRSNEAIEEECYLYFDIVVEIVQANRFSEVWGIENTFFD